MRRTIVLLLLLLASPLLAQTAPETHGSLTTSTCASLIDTGCRTLTVSTYGAAAIQLTGPWTGTVSFTGSVDGTNFRALGFVNSAGATVTSATANGIFVASIGGMKYIRAAFTTPTSGPVGLAIQASLAGGGGASGGGGGGGGAITCADGCDVAEGTTTDAAVGDADGTVNAHLREIAKKVDAGVAVTGTFWQATQPVSGTFFQATQPVSGTFFQTTQPVSGTFWQATQPVSIATMPTTAVTCAACATETTAAAIKAKTDNIPALGQALAAASVPIVLTAAQLTTLTPPAALTGFATAAKQPALGTAGTASTDVQTVQGIASGFPLLVTTSEAGNNLDGTITSAMTGTTSTVFSGMGAQGGSLRVYVTACTVSNSHATVGTDVVLQDGSGGTTLWTLPAGAVYGGTHAVFPTPLRTTANTALYAANVTTGASTKISCTGYKGL